MEVVASVVGSVLAEPCRIICGIICVRIDNFFKRRSNLGSLKNEMTSLIDLRNVVREKQSRMSNESRARVEDWLTQVDKLGTEVDELVSTISSTDDGNFLYSCFLPTKLCKLSSQLVKKIKSVKELKETGNFSETPVNVRPVEHIPAPSIIDQTTASGNLYRLLDLLMNDNVTRIGIWGMGGVGKTTLVKNLNNELLRRAPTLDFGLIIWVTVSKETNISRIQMQIAERVTVQDGMNQSEERMFVRLHKSLLEEKRFLIILDDVWEAVDLDLIGIPRPETCTQGKIIITSRSLDVCREMGTQVDLKVKVLNSEESWKLFCEYAGEVALDERIRPIAEVVANECDGLPLAIIVVGASMKGKAMFPLWKDALRALQCSEPLVKGMEDKVYKILKWSYDSLKNKQTKFCFLFCCLYPEDYDIEVRQLVQYWYCEGLLDERLNYEELENRGIAIVQNLKDSCLLEPGKDSYSVKMHDVVRDVGIWIVSSIEDECRSLVRSGIGLDCVSDSEFLSSYKRISFINNQFCSLPDSVVRCPEATTLLLQGNPNLAVIPFSFLHGFGALKILDLSRSGIEYLPSLAQLNQLRALILSQCHKLLELPPLDGLSTLLVLDCNRSGIRQLPESTEKMSSLRQLDVSKSSLQAIPFSAISKLSNLELLRLSYVSCSDEGRRLFEVLPLLKKLVTFYAQLRSIPHVSSNNTNFNWCGSIQKFQIVIGDGTIDTNTRDLKKASILLEKRVILDRLYLSQESIGWLLCKATCCELIECKGISQMFKNSISTVESFASLKVLKITGRTSTFQADTTNGASFDLLPNLEEIYLRYVHELESISDFSKILGLRFSKLRVIDISVCPKLKCLLFLEEHQSLENVRKIQVGSCEMLTCFFNYPNTTQHMDADLILPNLEKVTLWCLPSLENVCRNHEIWENLKVLKVVDCQGIKKLPLNILSTGSIKKIVGKIEWWEQLDWDREDTKLLLQNRFVAWRG